MKDKVLRRVLILVTIAISVLFLVNNGIRRGSFYGDSMGYYLYLPAVFIYHNLSRPDVIPQDKMAPGAKAVQWYVGAMSKENTVNGNFVDQYTYGVALMELPFFVLAYTYEKITGVQPDGYSDIYDYAIKLSAIVYSLLGLMLVYRILRRYFNENQSIITIVALLLGTNLFWFTLCQAGMAHIPLFFLYALLMQLCIKMHERQSWSTFLGAGFVAGLCAVIRPTDVLCLLIPLLYGVYSRATLKAKLVFIRNNIGGIGLFIAGFILPLVPQFMYWKALTGQWLYYSYGSQSFNWDKPRIIEGLFYFKNGWLPYSLVMIFSLLGLFIVRYYKSWALSIWALLPVYVYVIYSWYCFNYINGLGSRPMIHVYPLLALPLAAFIKFISDRRVYIRVAFFAVVLFFASVNICNSMQQAQNTLFSEDSNMMFNLQTLYRMHLRYKDFVCMDNGIVQPDSDKMEKVIGLAYQGFEDTSGDHYVKDADKPGGVVYHMLQGQEYLPSDLEVIYDKARFGPNKWLKCSGNFKCTVIPGYYDHHLLVLGVLHDGKFISWSACKIDNKIGLVERSGNRQEINIYHHELDKWGQVYFFVPIPKDIQQGDQIRLSVWNIAKLEMYLDDLSLDLYRQKD
ncbi:MAG: glycosyltransferase family 39 protein [Bacteroidetes bacterium]|nr:glycosyltransferase family 39 protein [Bacteroidota bacterium]